MFKFIITLQLQPAATRDEILARAPAVQAATRTEPGCLADDSLTCTDDPDRVVFGESWASKQAHTREWIAFHEPKRLSFAFETINVEP